VRENAVSDYKKNPESSVGFVEVISKLAAAGGGVLCLSKIMNGTSGIWWNTSI